MGVDRGGAVALVADLDLDEPPVNPVLGQVRDIGMPQAMDHQGRRQAEGIPVGLEPGVDLRRPDPPAPLGHPQCRVAVAAELRADVLDVVGHRLHRPPHHRGDVTAPRRLAPLGLTVADVQHPVPAELRRGRVAAPVRDIQPRGLGPAQPPGINDLEQGRVPVGGQRPLALRAHGPVDLVVGVIQERLQLLAGERPRFRAALIPVEVGDRVPLVADRHRVGTRPELVLAGGTPAIPAITEVLAEQPQVRLVAPDRRRSQPLFGHQRLRPLLHMRRPQFHGYSLVNARNRRTSRSRGAIVSSRSPRAVCWARHPRSIASNIASSGRSCTTPDTSSRCAAPARSPRPNPPSSPRNHNRSKAGSCTRRDHRATGEVRRHRPPAAHGYCGTPLTRRPAQTRPSDAIPAAEIVGSGTAAASSRDAALCRRRRFPLSSVTPALRNAINCHLVHRSVTAQRGVGSHHPQEHVIIG